MQKKKPYIRKPLDAEGRQVRRRYLEKNKESVALKLKEWRLTHKERVKELAIRGNIRRKYKMSMEQLQTMYDNQNGCCAICVRPMMRGKPGSTQMHMDHNHKTGVNRELLCSRCNLTLGKVGENTDLLQSMINYLVKHRVMMMQDITI